MNDSDRAFYTSRAIATAAKYELREAREMLRDVPKYGEDFRVAYFQCRDCAKNYLRMMKHDEMLTQLRRHVRYVRGIIAGKY